MLVGPQIAIPLINTAANLDLRWGEWLGIAFTSSLASAVAIEAVMVAGATAWFGDPGRALVPIGPLTMIIFLAALITRIVQRVPAWQSADRLITVIGAAFTALGLIRALVYPHLAATDFSWLLAIGSIVNIYAEQPHAIAGMILIGFWVWGIGGGFARHGGDYDLRRRHFFGFFTFLVSAIVIATGVAQQRDILTTQLALAVPTYAFLGLATLGQVRLAEVRDRIRQVGGEQRTLLLWRVTSFSMAIFSVFFVYVAAAIFTTGAYNGPLGVLGAIWGGIVEVVVAILTIPVTLFFLIFGPIIQGLFAGSGVAPPTCPTPMPGGTPTVGPGTTTPASCIGQRPGLPMTPTSSVSPEMLHLIYGAILAFVMVMLALFLIALLTRRMAGKGSTALDETRERITRAELQAERLVVTANRSPLEPPAEGTVRALYRAFLQASAEVGYLRRDDETAAEFARRLRQASVPQDAVRDLTAAYEAERYAGIGPDSGRYARAQAALRALLQAWRRDPNA